MTKKKEESNVKGPTLSRKITMKELCGGNVASSPPGFLGRVTGIAHEVIHGETQYGPWTKLKGQFFAQNKKGEKFSSGHCILPEPGNGLVAGQLASDEINEVQFSFDIYKTIDESVPVGYTFKTEAVINVEQSNMLESLIGSLPALPEK